MASLQGEGLDGRLRGDGVRRVLLGVPHVEHSDDHVDRGDEHDSGQHDVVEDGGRDVVLGLVDVVGGAEYHHDDAVQHLDSERLVNIKVVVYGIGCYPL